MYLYPKWIRLWHIINAIAVIILILTGISMHFNPEESFLFDSGRAVKWHNIAALILTLNYMVFVTGNILTENGKYYRLNKQNFFSDLGRQIRYYSFRMSKKEKPPFPVTLDRKFNPLQKFVYVLVMYIAVPLLIISGIGLILPEGSTNRIFGERGLIVTDILHITMGLLIALFMIIHIYACTLGAKPASLFKSMITGYYESLDD